MNVENNKTNAHQNYLAAGGRAIYDAFYREMGVTRYKPWAQITPIRQRRWIRIFEVGFDAAQATRR